MPRAGTHECENDSGAGVFGAASVSERVGWNAISETETRRGENHLYWMPMTRSGIDFGVELARGMPAYEDTLGAWWHLKASDRSHTRAYRNIAGFVSASLARPPRTIVDYACGAGHLLARFGALFPDARLIGLDGSACLLNFARRRLGSAGHGILSRARLIEMPLPAARLPRVKADLSLFVFPNMIWPSLRPNPRHLGRTEMLIARRLAREHSREEDPEEVFSFLVLGRLISMDLRRLLRRGGLCVRAEYAAARRDELSRADLARIAFEEGSLDIPVGGERPRELFRVLASAFFRSKVIGDVYEQAGRRRRRGGGYLLTVLRAL